MDRRILLSGMIGAGGALAFGLVGRANNTPALAPRRPRGLLAPGTAIPVAYDRADAVHVRDFGAIGDGQTNDTQALAAAARHVEKAGGGTLLLGGGTYLIGRQRRADNAPWSFAPDPVIDIRHCRRPVAVIGEGATLRCASGLRFGTFDSAGRATANAMPFTTLRELATPYRAAIWLEGNTGGITVAGVEIDGRIDEAIIGGPWGDTGWQINHCGVWLYNNTGPHVVADIDAHGHGQDGLALYTQVLDEQARIAPITVANVRASGNGRQGISLTGGRNVLIRNCVLNGNGRAGKVASNPGAGIDLEAELSLIRDVRIVDCDMIGNSGQGLVADNGDTERIAIENCAFVGVANYALWPNKPDMTFRDCTIIGAMVRCFEDPSGRRATRFIGCSFNDRLPAGLHGPFSSTRIDLGGSGAGTLFDRCTFDYSGPMQLPYSPASVRYNDCTLKQTAPERSYPNGIYTGDNRLDGNISIDGSRIRGRVTLNGRQMPLSA